MLASEARVIFRRNLQRIMTEKRIDQVDVVNALHVTSAAVSDWYNGKKYPRVDKMQALADFLGVKMSELTTQSEQTSIQSAASIDISRIPNVLPIRKTRIPLLGAIHAGEPTFSEESFEAYLEVGADIRCDFALRVVGDSMINVRIMDGDIVFIRKQDTVENGQIAAVLIDNDAALKRVRFLPNNTLMLQAENPNYAPIFIGGESEYRVFRILGKAVAFQSPVR